ncbi:MAG: hypothetical protein RQ885_01740 [Desulfurococcales archaeon]|jgi:hypothetical protein|nr:hypothetical protein [Desulfurococcales archaeon]
MIRAQRAMRSDNIEALISDFIYRYGERGRAVLEAVVRASQRLAREAMTPLPGDFDYRSVVEELGLMGYSYNPSPLLRILEKEYSLVRTTLHTSGQRWFVLSNKEAFEEYVEKLRSGGEEDPEALVIRLQLEALRMDEISRILRSLASKKRWSDTDYRRLYDISFKKMPKLLKIYRKIQEDPERWGSYMRDIEEIFALAKKLKARTHPQRGSEEEAFKSIDHAEPGEEKSPLTGER